MRDLGYSLAKVPDINVSIQDSQAERFCVIVLNEDGTRDLVAQNLTRMSAEAVRISLRGEAEAVIVRG